LILRGRLCEWMAGQGPVVYKVVMDKSTLCELCMYVWSHPNT